MRYSIFRVCFFICLTFLLNGCRSAGLTDEEAFNYTPAQEEHRTSPRIAEHSKSPKQVALLLPLSGNHAESAKAIREGFLASYYQNAQNSSKASVKIYDTTKESNIEKTYHLAVSEGADFVVGPLSKEDVLNLGNLSNQLQTPVLALNEHPAIKPNHNYIQFALAPEAEAEQIANKAWERGYRNASVIVPNNTWGKRTASAFTIPWQQQGGKIVQTVYVNANEDQSVAIQSLLGIDQSQQRANKIKSLLTEKVEYHPRRRKDIDVIIMAAPPEQARQLKPLLDFYYAENIPVYATSSIYSGTPNPKSDRDLNGVIFCDMPWLIDPQQEAKLQQLLSRNASNQSDQYRRLFAMGVDAHQLLTHLNQLHSRQFNGVTGSLSLGNNNQIKRSLAWAKIADGVPVQVR